jgi:serine/threonine protein phosphatase PrpC
VLLQEGAEKGSWPKDFAAKHKFSADPVIPLPDVSQVDLQPDADEFIVIATDGLWDCMPAGEACRFARWARMGQRGGRAVCVCMKGMYEAAVLEQET